MKSQEMQKINDKILRALCLSKLYFNMHTMQWESCIDGADNG